jgi:hypothetical protein
LFISTPNIAHVSIRLELLGGNFEYEPMGILDNTHLKYFTDHSLSEMVKRAGYGIVDKDFTANDFPNDVVKQMLKGYGLTPDKKFWEMISRPDARAFQHKFVLSPNVKATPKKLQNKAPEPIKPEQIRNAEYDDLKGKVRNLRQHAKEQAKIINFYETKNTELEADNQRLHGIISHRSSSLARRAISKARRNLTKNRPSKK